jgi:rubredoxin
MPLKKTGIISTQWVNLQKDGMIWICPVCKVGYFKYIGTFSPVFTYYRMRCYECQYCGEEFAKHRGSRIFVQLR